MVLKLDQEMSLQERFDSANGGNERAYQLQAKTRVVRPDFEN